MNQADQALKYNRRTLELDKKNLKVSFKIAKILFKKDEILEGTKDFLRQQPMEGNS